MNDDEKYCGADEEPLDQIWSLCTELALRPDKDFGWGKGKDNARQLGYADEWLTRLPCVVWESAAAVGNLFAVGLIRPGETVVDLGCGAGANACVAALLVGDAGKVYRPLRRQLQSVADYNTTGCSWHDADLQVLITLVPSTTAQSLPPCSSLPASPG